MTLVMLSIHAFWVGRPRLAARGFDLPAIRYMGVVPGAALKKRL
jgi:hypothetical protein